jgi:hypothetical protein
MALHGTCGRCTWFSSSRCTRFLEPERPDVSDLPCGSYIQNAMGSWVSVKERFPKPGNAIWLDRDWRITREECPQVFTDEQAAIIIMNQIAWFEEKETERNPVCVPPPVPQADDFEREIKRLRRLVTKLYDKEFETRKQNRHLRSWLVRICSETSPDIDIEKILDTKGNSDEDSSHI